MRILSVMGSPRFQGNTATVLGFVEDALSVGGHSVTRVNVVEKDVYGCRACNACKKVPDTPGCVVSDDTEGILNQMIQSELVILASPLYCWGFTAQLKALLDRCYSLKKPVGETMISLVSGKKVAFLMTAAGPYENNLALVEPVFSGISWFTEMDIAGKLLLPECTEPSAISDEIKAQAKEFAAQLTMEE